MSTKESDLVTAAFIFVARAIADDMLDRVSGKAVA